MDQRIFHGKITPSDLARDLLSAFNRGNLRAQAIGENEKIAVQVATSPNASSGGQIALTVQLLQTKEGVLVQIGKQGWLGVAASLGQSAISTFINPWNLLNRLDDIAQDIENLQLSEKIWEVVSKSARAHASGHHLSEKLTRLICEFCDTPNLVGEASCIACGAPLGSQQPQTCPQCGYVTRKADKTCPNCRATL